MKKIVYIFAIIVCGLVGVARAQQPPPASAVGASPESVKASSKSVPVLPPEKANPVKIPRFQSAPAVDGRLDEDIWKSAAVLKDFYQIEPGDNIAPSRPTEVFMGYDSKFLYIGFRAYDEAGKVRATVAKRDAVFDDDNVGIFLDTFNDQRRAYVLVFNPLGIQQDAILTEGRGEDYSFDLVMESKGLVGEDGYVVEVAIPFRSLRYEAGPGKSWGVHILRQIKRFNNETSSWMPLSRDVSGLLHQAGHITGIEGISTERLFEIIPTLTISESGRRVRSVPLSVTANDPSVTDPGRFVNSPANIDPGLTMKLGITPTVTLDFTANPDFAQVEADQPVITANQRFPIFFSEKRPFFLEGIDIFQTPLSAVHTRAIIDPDYAVKLSGKQGRNTFGALLASDNAPGSFSEEEISDPELFESIEKFIDKNAYVGVLRLKRDIGKESSLGFIGTSYNFIERHNQLGGFDGRFRIDPQTIFSFQVLGTTSRQFFFEPEQGDSRYRTGNGLGYYWEYDKTKRHFGYNVNGQGRTRDYRANVGFTPRTDTNTHGLFLRFSSEPDPKARLISWRVINFTHYDHDWQGRVQAWESEIHLSLNFSRQTFFGAGYEGGYERVFEEEFGPKRSLTQRGAFAGNDPERSSYKKHFFLNAGTNPSKKYSLFMSTVYRIGHLDYDFGAGPRYPRVSPAALRDPDSPLDPGAGNLLEVYASAGFRPTDALSTSLDYTKNRLTRHDTRRVAFEDNIYSLNTTYQFTRYTFARARLDYTTLEGGVRGQYLLGWAPNPGTSFYLGYNDDLTYNGFSPFTAHREPGFHRNRRTFFIKMSYLFRYSL